MRPVGWWFYKYVCPYKKDDAKVHCQQRTKNKYVVINEQRRQWAKLNETALVTEIRTTRVQWKQFFRVTKLVGCLYFFVTLRWNPVRKTRHQVTNRLMMLAAENMGADDLYHRQTDGQSSVETERPLVNQLKRVELRPFNHQVGGHTCVFEINPFVICKPYTEREFLFYKSHPEELDRFVPSFQGIVQVHCEKNSDQLIFSGHVPNTVNQMNDRSRLDKATTLNKDCNGRTITGLDSWSLTCIDRQMKKYGYWADRPSETFIMLKNVVAEYKFPCIVDIKLGTKQYSEDSSLDKQRLFQDRCQNSTSASLGLRICGMQVYKLDKKRFIKHDKYHGRALDSQGVGKTLRHFFHNGREPRIDIKQAILKKLKDLINVLDSQKSFLFLSCSLLLVYDGRDPRLCSDQVVLTDQEKKTINEPISSLTTDIECTSCDNSVDVRIIDFAHTVRKDQMTIPDVNTDGGIVFGLKVS
ncbi:hypothetical protein ScPMuIL_015267 [Solemya velum]